jgi:hypothetical protein
MLMLTNVDHLVHTDLRKWYDKDPETRYFPTIDDIEHGRKREDTWLWIMTHFVLFVEPTMKERAKYDLLSNWCTVNSEALLFLLLENSYKMWEQEI